MVTQVGSFILVYVECKVAIPMVSTRKTDDDHHVADSEAIGRLRHELIKSTGNPRISSSVKVLNQRPYRLRRSTIGTSYGGVALQWRRLCGCVHEGALARPWTGNGQFCSAINCNNRRKTCTALSFFRFPVKLLCM